MVRLVESVLVMLRRYKAALEKANYASLALKEDARQEEEGTLGEDEDELQEVLARARRAAAAKKEEEAAAAEGPSVARIAEEAARRRAADEAQRAADAAAGNIRISPIKCKGHRFQRHHTVTYMHVLPHGIISTL